MTAPVTTTATSIEVDEGTYETAFSMPSERTMESLPVPNNSDITIKKTKPVKRAVWSFSGYATESEVEKEWKHFQDALTKHAIAWTGTQTLAQYNDPRTPPRMRTNELWVEVKGQGKE